MANWYYAVGGQTQGPVDEEQLRSKAHQGTLTPTSYVVREGETVRQSLGDVEAGLGLARNPWGSYADAAASPPPAAAPSPSEPAGPAGTGMGPAATGSGPATGTWTEPGTSGAGWEQPGGAGGGWSQPGPAAGGWGTTTAPPTWSSGPPAAWGGYPGAQPYPGSQWATTAGPGYGPNGERLAEWWQRALAKLLDVVVVAIPGFILFAIVALDEIRDNLDAGDSSFEVSVGGRSLAGQFLWGVIGLLYFALLNGRGQTLGKMVLGIKVVRADNGAPPGTGKGFARHIIQFLAWFLSCLGMAFVLLDSLWPLWDKQRQALHDKVGGTLVVRAR